MFRGLTSLERLAVHTNNLTYIPGGILSGLTNLRVLDLDDNQITELRYDAFRGLDKLNQVCVSPREQRVSAVTTQIPCSSHCMPPLQLSSFVIV